MTQPTEFPDWATTFIQEEKTIEGETTVFDNKSPPTEEWKLSGELYRENLPRQYVNYNFDLIGLWVRHLNSRNIVGDVHPTTTGETAGAISSRLGGTWVSIGTQLIGAETVDYFKKTI